MKFIFLLSMLISSSAFASSSYLSGANTLVLAAQAVYTGAAGFGTTNCNLCHINGQTGAGTIASGFGTDFQTAGGTGGSMSQAQLQTILSNTTFQNTDSDGDGQTNSAEIQANTNPNDCSSGGGTCPTTSGGSGGGGGCGFVTTLPTQGPGGGFFLLLLAPLLLSLGLKTRTQKA